jgi:hypothetical protein
VAGLRVTILVALCFALLSPFSYSIASADPSPSPANSAASTAATALDVARSRIDTMLRTGHTDTARFSAAFLAQVPASKVDEIIASLKASLGEYRTVEFTPAKFIAHFAKGTDDILLHLDADNKIDGLFFRPPAMVSSSLDEGLRALRPATGNL